MALATIVLLHGAEMSEINRNTDPLFNQNDKKSKISLEKSSKLKKYSTVQS